MKKVTGLFVGMALFAACQKSEVVSPFTGNQITYGLEAGSAYPISGTVVFKERKDGAVTISVTLQGTADGTTSPVHLHLGDMTAPQAEIAALLSPVIGKTGESETILKKFSDETTVTYAALIGLEACIKVHLSDTGAGRDIILAAGNVGASLNKSTASGRLGIAPCKSN